MKSLSLAIITGLLVSLSSFAAQLDDLKWLAGSWSGNSPAGLYEVYFSEPSGGIILGLAKLTPPSGPASFYEYTQIKSVEGVIVLSPMPFGQPGVSFTATEISASRVVFENADHAFPHRVIYELNENGQFTSTVEGNQNGQDVKLQFVMQKK